MHTPSHRAPAGSRGPSVGASVTPAPEARAVAAGAPRPLSEDGSAPLVSVLIPAYNEEATIEELVRRMLALPFA